MAVRVRKCRLVDAISRFLKKAPPNGGAVEIAPAGKSSDSGVAAEKSITGR
jgi:hypothetical protein